MTNVFSSEGQRRINRRKGGWEKQVEGLFYLWFGQRNQWMFF
jgi:hypothetical protein